MKKFKVIENGGGGLILVTFAADGETMDYIHSGYEYVPGQLTQDLQELRKGSDPIADDWDGNEIEEWGTDFESAFPWEQEGPGWECIVDNDGEYYQKMGGAGQDEFSPEVIYDGGESRENPGKAVDYMMTEVHGVELYAEMEPGEDETATYEPLKAEIIRQAKAAGIDPERLHFWLDD